MEQPKSVDEIFEELVRYIERGESNGRPVHFIGEYKQALYDLLESEAVNYYVIDEGGYEASREPVVAIPLSTLRELLIKDTEEKL